MSAASSDEDGGDGAIDGAMGVEAQQRHVC
jgi:hypothetical protein